ncbi:hypothetical protein EON65_19425 [archaeon]|nr:MAG: hypothetical protein EON65_19425 [archaeon]
MAESKSSGDVKEDGEIEKLFNSWTSKSVASILVDGQKLNDVFSIIKKQLDYLLRRQNQFSDVIQTLNGTEPYQPPEPFVATVAPQISTSLGSQSFSQAPPNTRHNSMIPDAAQRRISMQPAIDPLIIESLRNEVDNVKLLMKKDSESHDNKHKTLEKWATVQLKNIEIKLDELGHISREQQKSIDANNERMDAIEVAMRQLNTMLSSMNDNIGEIDKSQSRLAKETNIAVDSMKDSLVVHDLRSKHIESRLTAAASMAERTHNEIESYPEKFFVPIQRELTELNQDKANRSELDTKADLSILFNKADQSSVSALETLAEELDRRLVNLKFEMHEKTTNLDSKMDRRVDRIVAYCLRELKKELKQYAAHGEEAEETGTDIGKVRCLVCNQITPQQRTQEVIFGGPPLKNTLRPQQRSNSPPARHTTTLPPAEPAGTTVPSQRPLPSEVSPNPRAKSRMVKLTATPEHAHHNNNDPVYDDNDVEDFNYRANAHSRPMSAHIHYHGQKDEQTDNHLVHIKSGAHAEGYNYRPTTAGQVLQQKEAAVFKDVKE